MKEISNKEETPQERFVRVAQRRTNKILKEFKLLTNLKNPSNYKSTMSQRTEILAAIRTALEEVEYSWSGTKIDKKVFEFKSFPPEAETE
jgi:hypothetical protein